MTNHYRTLTEFPFPEAFKELINPFKSIIFDMDGTLINTETIHAGAIVSILPKQSVSFSKAEIEKHFHGMNDRMVYNKLIELGVSVPFATSEAFVEAKNQAIIHLVQTKKEILNSVMKKDTHAALKIAKEEKKQLMLVTASEKIVTENLLQALEVYHLFDCVITAQDTHFTKPSSSPYFHAMRKSQHLTHECLIFEDSETGLRAAHEAGAKVVKASWYH